MVPAVEDWSQRQDRRESNGTAEHSGTPDSTSGTAEETIVYTFKGDRLLSADQLRAELQVQPACDD